MYGKDSHKDRHSKIGEGHIGEEAFEKIINHPKLKHLPFYLETPNELDGYAKEIELLKKHQKRTRWYLMNAVGNRIYFSRID